MQKQIRTAVLVLCTVVVFFAAWRVARLVLDEIGFRLFTESVGPARVAAVIEWMAPIVALAVVVPVAVHAGLDQRDRTKNSNHIL